MSTKTTADPVQDYYQQVIQSLARDVLAGQIMCGIYMSLKQPATPAQFDGFSQIAYGQADSMLTMSKTPDLVKKSQDFPGGGYARGRGRD